MRSGESGTILIAGRSTVFVSREITVLGKKKGRIFHDLKIYHERPKVQYKIAGSCSRRPFDLRLKNAFHVITKV